MMPEPVIVLEHEGWQRCGHCGADIQEGYMAEHLEERCIVLHPDGGQL